MDFRIAPSILSAHFSRLGEAMRHVIAAGADPISVHPDASPHVDRMLQPIRNAGRKAGRVFNPAAPLDMQEWTIDKVDLMLIMSVNPGFGGQSCIGSARRAELERTR